MTPADYRASRLKLGLTQAGLAALLGLDPMTISRRERGQVAISREAEHALRVLDVERREINRYGKVRHNED